MGHGNAPVLIRWWWVLGGVAFISYIVGIGWVVSLPFPGDAEEHVLCDQQVPILLHSNNMVDVVRAGIIVRQINCGIGRRIKP